MKREYNSGGEFKGTGVRAGERKYYHEASPRGLSFDESNRSTPGYDGVNRRWVVYWAGTYTNLLKDAEADGAMRESIDAARLRHRSSTCIDSGLGMNMMNTIETSDLEYQACQYRS